MSGGISAGGLITGIDSNAIITQLIQLERAPITRFQSRITALESQRTAVSELRGLLQTLRDRSRDFQLFDKFSQFQASSVDSSVLTAAASGANPSVGSYTVEVVKLATATVATGSARLGASVNPGAALSASGFGTTVNGGTFSINGVQFNVDPNAQSLNDVLNDINGSAAGVSATYDAVSDKITLTNSAGGDASIINFGASADTSNFLAAINLTSALQSTGGGGSTEVTSSRNLGAVNGGSTLNTVNFGGGAVSGGTFAINGVSIAIDPTTDSLSDVIQRINQSDAGVTASLDAATDTIRVVSSKLGSRTVKFTSGTSNFLDVANLTTAVQTTGSDSQFKIDGGAVQTRNSNIVTDAIGGVSLTLASVGTTTVNVGLDEETILEDVRSFVTAFNEGIARVRSLTAKDGTLSNDGSIRSINSTLQNSIFQQVTGIGGSFSSLIDIGITTGSTFDASAPFSLQIDEDKFLNALREDPANINDIFANDAKNGIADTIYTYLNDISSTSGFLNQRARSNGSIDRQIQGLNGRIDAVERRVAQREQRLRAQFARLEQISSEFQSQASSLGAIR